jgi:flagellar biosynthetic protein FliQ
MVPELQDIMDVARNMLWVCIQLSMPTLLTALVVGVMISLVQTVTSVQEMTLTFVPKLFAVVIVVALTMPWILSVITEYTKEALRMFSTYYE